MILGTTVEPAADRYPDRIPAADGPIGNATGTLESASDSGSPIASGSETDAALLEVRRPIVQEGVDALPVGRRIVRERLDERLALEAVAPRPAEVVV